MNSSRALERTVRRLTGCLLCLVLPACGSLTAGGVGGDGEARVVVSGDESEAAAPSASTLPAFQARQEEQEDGPEGQLKVDFRLSLVASDGTVRTLTNDEVEVQVDLRGEQQVEVQTIPVPAGEYDEIRILFSEVNAEVESGLVIDGVPYTGEVHVELQDLNLLVTRSVDLSIREDLISEIFVDLNAGAWLQELDPVSGTISEEFFQALVSVRVVNP